MRAGKNATYLGVGILAKIPVETPEKVLFHVRIKRSMSPSIIHTQKKRAHRHRATREDDREHSTQEPTPFACQSPAQSYPALGEHRAHCLCHTSNFKWRIKTFVRGIEPSRMNTSRIVQFERVLVYAVASAPSLLEGSSSFVPLGTSLRVFM